MNAVPFQPDPSIVALGIRQPWAELILRGLKTIEVRSLDTQRRGTIYLYSARKLADSPAALAAVEAHGLDLETLPRGVLVGSVEIRETRPCTAADATAACVPAALLRAQHGWHLANPQRFETPLPVRFLPYGIWFYPFRRRGGRPPGLPVP